MKPVTESPLGPPPFGLYRVPVGVLRLAQRPMLRAHHGRNSMSRKSRHTRRQTTSAEAADAALGVALDTRGMLGPAERFLGRPIRALNVMGGGATWDARSENLADSLGVAVRQVRDPIQGKARGSVRIAAVGLGLGLASFPDVGREVEIRADYRPALENRPLCDDMCQTSLDPYYANKAVHRRLNGHRAHRMQEATRA